MSHSFRTLRWIVGRFAGVLLLGGIACGADSSNPRQGMEFPSSTTDASEVPDGSPEDEASSARDWPPGEDVPGPTGDASPPDSGAESPPDEPACQKGAQTITFVHVNDLHSRYTPEPEGNRLARVAGYVKQVRAENPYTLFTDGGDAHEKGCVADQITRGRSTIEVMETLRFDVRTVGNHDFAWGLQEFLRFTRDPHAQVVLTNVTYTGPNPSDFGALPWAVLEVGCLRIGFFGLVSDPWDDQDRPYAGDFYPETPTRRDYLEIASQVIEALRNEVDLLVLVSHLGLGMDEAIANVLPGIDVILGGHSHSRVTDLRVIGDTAIVQSASGADFVTRLDLVVDLSTRRVVDRRHEFLINLPGLLPLDEEVDARIAGIVRTMAPRALETVGFLARGLAGKALSDFAARAVRAALGTDAALLDPDTTWSGLRAGPQRPEDLHGAYLVEREPPGTPGFSALTVAEVSGADLRRIQDGMTSWSLVVPETLVPEETYRIAVQRRVSARPDLHLPEGVLLQDVRPWGEVWEALEVYAVARTAACRFMDVDEPLPGCSPSQDPDSSPR